LKIILFENENGGKLLTFIEFDEIETLLNIFFYKIPSQHWIKYFHMAKVFEFNSWKFVATIMIFYATWVDSHHSVWEIKWKFYEHDEMEMANK
jgi:hypothetical protein